jgi:hypothetical protein
MLRIEVPLEKPFPEIRERLFASLKVRENFKTGGAGRAGVFLKTVRENGF